MICKSKLSTDDLFLLVRLKYYLFQYTIQINLMIKLLIKFNLFVNQNQKNLKVSNRKFMLASSKNKNCSDLSNDKSASKHH